MLKSVTTNTFYQILSRIFSSGSSFLITVFVARHFGVSGYGDIAKVTAFVSLFYLLVDLGCNAIYLQLTDKKEELSSLLTFRLVIGCILFFVLSITTLVLPYSPVTHIGYSPFVKIGVIFFSLTFLSQAISLSTTALFQKKLSYVYLLLSSAIGAVVSLIAMGVVIFFSLPLFTVLLAYIVGNFAGAIISLFFVDVPLFSKKINTAFLQKLIIQTLPITIMLLLNLIYFRVDIILLSLFKSTGDVAIYDLSYKFFDFLISLPLFLANSIYPHLLATGKNSRTDLLKVHSFMGLFILLGVCISILAWVLSPFIGFIKSDFLPSIFSLRLLLLSLPIFFATSILQWILIAKKKQVFLALVYAAFLFVNVILNIIFIPQFSYKASAIITGVSEVGVFFCLWMFLLLKKNI